MPGNGRPGEGRAWRRREASAQVRKSADCRERGGAASGSQPAGQVGCPGLTLGDSAGAACRGVSCRPSADFPKVSLTFATASRPGQRPSGQTWARSQVKEGSSPSACRGGAEPMEGPVSSPVPVQPADQAKVFNRITSLRLTQAFLPADADRRDRTPLASAPQLALQGWAAPIFSDLARQENIREREE
ncbi:uncharacterized protein LOC118148433 isoform X1 [Callithrix jacchus]|uniref:uncharacterized protein LOC118148433 n=1 Tax=Callithrix jacchus TaxID=9483 RepID=UPI00159D2CC7|nr:uncharacterized protein LOC118148433 [Callithrix jacchus]